MKSGQRVKALFNGYTLRCKEEGPHSTAWYSLSRKADGSLFYVHGTMGSAGAYHTTITPENIKYFLNQIDLRKWYIYDPLEG